MNLILLQVGEELARKSEASPEGACERACERGEKYLKSRGRKIRTGSIGQAGVYTEEEGLAPPPCVVCKKCKSKS